jgi:hypothetical protein
MQMGKTKETIESTEKGIEKSVLDYRVVYILLEPFVGF